MTNRAAMTVVPPMPRAARLAAGGVSLLVLLSALAGAAAAALNSPTVWFMLGFEAVIAFASVFGVLVGVGRFREGPAITLVCVAGTVAAGSLLGYLAGRGNVGMGPGWFLRCLIAREAASAVIIAAAGWAVLVRRPHLSFRRLGFGLGCGLAFGAISLALWEFSGRLAALGTMPGALVGFASAITLLGLLAAAAHLLIGAFETGVIDETAASAE